MSVYELISKLKFWCLPQRNAVTGVSALLISDVPFMNLVFPSFAYMCQNALVLLKKKNKTSEMLSCYFLNSTFCNVDQIRVCPQKPLGVAIILILPWVFYSRLEVRACRQYNLWFTQGYNGIRSSQIITGGGFSSRESAWWVFLSAASLHIFKSLEFQEESVISVGFLYSFFPARSSLWALKGAVMQCPCVMFSAQLSFEAVSLIHVFKLMLDSNYVVILVLNQACFLYSVKLASSSTECMNVH